MGGAPELEARRRFLEALLAVAASLGLPPTQAGCAHEAPAAVVPRLEAPTALSLGSLDEVVARLIPTDALPGAREAGVAAFIDRQLALPAFLRFRLEVAEGLARVEARARSLALPREEALDQALGAMERGELSGEGHASAHCFLVLLILTLEGFLSDPSHGGNRGGIGFAVTGLGPARHAHGG